MRTIAFTTELNLCSGCGVCAGVCPKGCIEWKFKDGFYQPEIDRDACISCGLCGKACPGLGHDFAELPEREAVKGAILFCRNAWSRDPAIRHVSASGGTVSVMVKSLLQKKIYDDAFLVDSYDYHGQLKTIPVTADDLKDVPASDYPKSRYLPVSHEDAIRYIRKNRDRKVIFVGTSCATRGIRKAVRSLSLEEKNYLYIGLFCDRVFQYNVMDYFQQSHVCEGKKLERLHFKNKESGGWPGNMKLFFADGSTAYLDQAERAKAKDYFMPERCLYCIDKLNVCADISVGDNYTGQNTSSLGSNSVIIRTESGLRAWITAEECLESYEVPVDRIMEGQYIDWRLNNLQYGKIKEEEVRKRTGETVVLNRNVSSERDMRDYSERLKRGREMLFAGKIYDTNPDALALQMKKSEKRENPGKLKSLLSRVGNHVKRQMR